MPEAFINCPECEALLMADTARCPQCSFVIDAKRAEAALDTSNDWDITHHAAVVDCPKCGEFNGSGLVRCWSCGSFLRPEIEALYHKMLAERTEVEFSPLPEISLSGEIRLPAEFVAESDTRVDDEPTDPPAAPSSTPADDTAAKADDTDFELDPAYAEFVPGEPADAPEQEQAGETYSLSATAESSSAVAGSTEPTESNPESVAPESAEASAAETEATETAAGVSHSEATGGDVLLEIALQEEQESSKQDAARQMLLEQRKKSQAARRKKVAGRPGTSRPATAGAPDANKSPETNKPPARKKRAAPPRKFPLWLNDVRLHEVVPSKVKMKPSSLESQYRPADVGFSTEQMLIAVLVRPASLFSRGSDNKDELRDKLRKHMESGETTTASEKEKDTKEKNAKGKDTKDSGFPAAAHLFVPRDKVAQIKVVQPAAYLHESMFAGVDVFGEGRIAVLLPRDADKAEPQWFLSFALTEFRRFSAALEKHWGVKDLGLVEGVPLSDNYTSAQCHYSETKFEVLPVEQMSFYRADPQLNLELLGWRCESCGLVVGEEARRKEKIGGLNGKGIAKSKCPKCGAKFGTTALHRVSSQPAPAEDSAKEKASAEA